MKGANKHQACLNKFDNRLIKVKDTVQINHFFKKNLKKTTLGD